MVQKIPFINMDQLSDKEKFYSIMAIKYNIHDCEQFLHSRFPSLVLLGATIKFSW